MARRRKAADDDQLPLDPDVEVADIAGRAPRPAHLQQLHLVLVAVGGAIGTGMREALSLLLPPVAGIPLTTAGINVVGALLLGFLFEALARLGHDVGHRRAVRLLLGTGVLGGFTTYSAMATDTVLLLFSNKPLAGTAYALGTLVFGAAATAVGIAGATRLTREKDS